jgi:hypothetical protein
MVTTCGAQGWVTVLVTTTRRTRLTCATRRGAGLAFTEAFADWTTLGRGESATWTAPPPMIAPPAAHAQSFARAIRTDIAFNLFACQAADGPFRRAIR